MRAILFFGVLLLLAFGILYLRMSFPNEAHLFGRRLDTSALAWLQGNHRFEFDQVNQEKEVLVLGHRGSGRISKSHRNVSIGNTRRTIQAAIDAEVDWIEIDIRISKDGQLVVFHDRTLGLKTNCKPQWNDLGISDLDWSELKSLELDLEEPESMLLLNDVLEDFDHSQFQWVFDIKSEPTVQLDKAKMDSLLPIIRELGPERVILFGTFDILSLYRRAANEEDNFLDEYNLGVVMLVRDKLLSFLFNRQHLIDQCVELDAAFLVIPGMFAEPSFIKRAKQTGLEVLVWDCEHPVDQKHFVHRGIAGLIVDDPSSTLRRWNR